MEDWLAAEAGEHAADLNMTGEQFAEAVKQELLAWFKSMKAGTGHNPASWVADEAIWERAKKATKGGKGAGEPYALIAHVYRNMGGRIKKGKK